MNQVATTAARRRIVKIEKRIGQQWALLEQLISADDDASEATRTLRALHQTLALNREHLRFLLRAPAQSKRPT